MEVVPTMIRNSARVPGNSVLTIIALLIISVWAAVPLIFREHTYIIENFSPGLGVLCLSFLNLLAVHFTRSNVLKLMQIAWLTWPVVGTYFSIGHFFERKLWAPLNLYEANYIFLAFSTTFIWSCFVASRVIYIPKNPLLLDTPKLVENIPIILFPIFYLIVVLSGPNIISGSSIVSLMYVADRGPIYALRALMILFVLFCAFRAMSSTKEIRALWIALLLFGLITTVLDGKRDIAIISVLASGLFIVTRVKRLPIISLALGFVGLVALYAIVDIIRAGRDEALDNWTTFATIAGVEYRDFVHSINYWSRDYIETFGYKFWLSNLGSVLNRNILEVFGFDKDVLIAMDSARSWQRAFESEFGIRVGIVAELYYAMGYPAIFVVGFFGFAVVFLLRVAQRSSGFLKISFCLIVCALLVTSIFSQSSMTLGYLVTLTYGVSGLVIWRIVVRSLASKAGPVARTHIAL